MIKVLLKVWITHAEKHFLCESKIVVSGSIRMVKYKYRGIKSKRKHKHSEEPTNTEIGIAAGHRNPVKREYRNMNSSQKHKYSDEQL